MTTQNTVTTVSISSRSRNLGLGWSTQPAGRGTAIQPPTRADAAGGLRAVEQELERMRRITSGGTYHCVRLFVGGKAVVGWDWAGHWADGEHDLGFLLEELRQGNVVTVRVSER